ncbi:unnamed protein product [Debaryomyces fabryi]|nr:unnamed protein product [Debaryomyces fabryi]
MDKSIRIPRTRSRTGCFTCRKRKKKCDELLYPVCQNCQEKNLACQWPLKKHEFHKNMEEVKYIGYDDKASKTRETNSRQLKRNSAQLHNSYSEDETQPKKRNEGHKGPKETSFMQIRPFNEAEDLLSIDNIENDISSAQNTMYGNKLPQDVLVHPSDSTPDTYDNGASDIENHGKYAPIRHPTDSNAIKMLVPSKLDSIQLQKKRHNYFLERIAMQQDCVDSEDEITDIAPVSPFEIDSLIDNDYILNDKDKQDLTDRAQSPIPKAESSLNDLNTPETAFPDQLTMAGSNKEANAPNSLVPLKTVKSTHKGGLPN